MLSCSVMVIIAAEISAFEIDYSGDEQTGLCIFSFPITEALIEAYVSRSTLSSSKIQ